MEKIIFVMLMLLYSIVGNTAVQYNDFNFYKNTATIDILKKTSSTELEINEQVKYYLDNYALTAECFDYETGGYTLSCIGCGYSEKNNLSISKILDGAVVYQNHGINITGLYIELPVTETVDIGRFENLVKFECISNDVSGLTCTARLEKLKTFTLRYVQGQSENALINVCRIIEECTALEKIEIDGIYTDSSPKLIEYLKSLYPVEIYSEGIQYYSEIDYLSLGYEKGCYYQEICEQFFYSGSSLRWEYGSVEKQFSDGKTERMYIPVTGYEKDGKIIDTNYSELLNTLNETGISQHAFEQFQLNASKAYYEIDGELYMGTIDGGEWGWDYAYIDSYELPDSNTIQYNCIVKSHADYDDRPFTFTLKNNSGVWELYECSDPYAFAAYFKNPVKIAKQIQLETLSD